MKSIHFQLGFRPGMPEIVWGKPDHPRRPLCAVCHGALPVVSLMFWKSDGSAASFCDRCVEKWITTTTEGGNDDERIPTHI